MEEYQAANDAERVVCSLVEELFETVIQFSAVRAASVSKSRLQTSRGKIALRKERMGACVSSSSPSSSSDLEQAGESLK